MFCEISRVHFSVLRVVLYLVCVLERWCWCLGRRPGSLYIIRVRKCVCACVCVCVDRELELELELERTLLCVVRDHFREKWCLEKRGKERELKEQALDGG